jgi:hypothetical protein
MRIAAIIFALSLAACDYDPAKGKGVLEVDGIPARINLGSYRGCELREYRKNFFSGDELSYSCPVKLDDEGEVSGTIPYTIRVINGVTCTFAASSINEQTALIAYRCYNPA